MRKKLGKYNRSFYRSNANTSRLWDTNTGGLCTNRTSFLVQTQVCRAFLRGRCVKVKVNDSTLLIGDPKRCSETHDKPKSEIKCCSIPKPDDETTPAEALCGQPGNKHALIDPVTFRAPPAAP